MMIVLEEKEGLAFARPYEVAAMMPDGHGRCRVVRADGGWGYRPGAVPDGGPWVGLGAARVLPHLLQPRGDRWVDPPGFSYPLLPLAPVALPELAPPLAGLPCHQDRIISLRARGVASLWHTDEGDFPCPTTAVQSAALHPDLVLATRGNYFNRQRLRRIRRDLTRHCLVMDDGSSIMVSHKFHFKVAQRLGLPHFYFLEPALPQFLRHRPWEYPYDLVWAKADRLRADFSSAHQLITDLIWQGLRYRELGMGHGYGKDYREYWYNAIKATLYRAGFLTRGELDWDPDDRDGRQPDHWLALQTILAEMVADRALTFSELGFVDSEPQYRHIGDRRPEVIVVCEKTSLKDAVDELARQFGVSTIVLGGQPSLLCTEHFAHALRAVVTGPVTIIAYVDYDPAGWIIARSFIEQLARYDVFCPGGVSGYLVLPQYFTQEELDLFALPLTSESETTATKNRLWMELTGGIGGEAKGMLANRLQPVERLVEILGRLLG